ncbi:MAG: 5,10-methylenetetrahydrofolate reductase [Candidatus Omnitrophica bacterium CG11_big_fil_rev_8_21_14_0_20_42_13]|uniref:Methylenetetrahydrofolate reductase n=1 Tax=Candidatus Ghiorseimicrobium undicola TaxID=1974746 RepID=A0A2H0LWR7_9BACT|nr:MAG: 5,10-methylenetetrahydrofolate reductase [Candidatus Omnitrophica bacterium CG11_big_fil_rev_8_21_14_0_20_42_13]
MSLRKKVESGKFILTSEIGPPKGIETKVILEDCELIRSRVDAINVTDLQSSVMRLGSLAVSAILKQHGFDPVYQLTCRDRNRLALQSDILSAASLGIENLLLLTGDHQSLGDHPDAKGVFDLDSVQLIEAVRGLESGVDMAGKKLQGELPRFLKGAVVNPGAEPVEPQILKMKKKIEAGAEFFQTQAIYEVDKFAKFMEEVRDFKVPIFAGIVMLKSAGMARFMNKNVAGVGVPDNLINEIDQAKDKQVKSVEIAARLIKELKPLCQGIHIMSIGWDKLVPKVLDAAGL